MSYLGRRIDPSEWTPDHNLGPAEVPADLIAGRKRKELVTKDNRLSFWESDTSPQEALERAALALASSGDRLDPLHVVWIEKAELERQGVQFDPGTADDVKVPDLARWHRDAKDLDAFRLARVASTLATAVRGGRQLKNLTLDEVHGLLQAAVDSGRVRLQNLKGGLQQALRAGTE